MSSVKKGAKPRFKIQDSRFKIQDSRFKKGAKPRDREREMILDIDGPSLGYPEGSVLGLERFGVEAF